MHPHFTKITLMLHLHKNAIYPLNELTNLEKDIEKFALKKDNFQVRKIINFFKCFFYSKDCVGRIVSCSPVYTPILLCGFINRG